MPDDLSPPASKRPRRGIQVIARAATILRALDGENEGLSLGQIAQRVSLPRSTVQRIVGALEEEGLLMSASPTARVRLGPTILRLANTARIDIAKMAHPYLCELSKAVHETVDFSMLVGDRAVFVDQIEAAHQLKAVYTIGDSIPLHCSAHGKALLAAIDREQAIDLMRRELADDIAPLEGLIAEIDSVRVAGYAIDDEENMAGICAVGGTIRDSLGNIAAVSIPVPALRFSEKREMLADSLTRYCGRISSALGSR